MLRKYVIFKSNNTNYGIPIDFVDNIEKRTKITRVPSSQNIVKGVINLRGNIIPVIDYNLKSGNLNSEYDSNSRIIILNVNDIKLGLLVESSSEVLELEDSTIDPISDVLKTNDSLVSGVGKDGERLIQIIDLNSVLEL